MQHIREIYVLHGPMAAIDFPLRVNVELRQQVHKTGMGNGRKGGIEIECESELFLPAADAGDPAHIDRCTHVFFVGKECRQIQELCQRRIVQRFELLLDLCVRVLEHAVVFHDPRCSGPSRLIAGHQQVVQVLLDGHGLLSSEWPFA